jgi:hypothetical protein
LKSQDRLTVNTQFEQVQFRELGPSLNIQAMVEQVSLNEQDGNQPSLIQAVINDLLRRFQNRQRLPYSSIRHFREHVNATNSIRVRVTGIPFCGPESFAYLLICDRLIELRPAFLETLGEKVSMERGEDSKFKSLSDDDVWFSHMEIMDDQSINLTFLVLTFDVREKLKEHTSKPPTTRFES